MTVLALASPARTLAASGTVAAPQQPGVKGIPLPPPPSGPRPDARRATAVGEHIAALKKAARVSIDEGALARAPEPDA